MSKCYARKQKKLLFKKKQQAYIQTVEAAYTVTVLSVFMQLNVIKSI